MKHKKLIIFIFVLCSISSLSFYIFKEKIEGKIDDDIFIEREEYSTSLFPYQNLPLDIEADKEVEEESIEKGVIKEVEKIYWIRPNYDLINVRAYIFESEVAKNQFLEKIKKENKEFNIQKDYLIYTKPNNDFLVYKSKNNILYEIYFYGHGIHEKFLQSF